MPGSVRKIKIIFALAFSQGIFELLGVKSLYLDLLIELLILSLFISSFSRENRKDLFLTPKLMIFLLFSFHFLLSMILNGSGLYQSFLFYRFFLWPYLLYLSLVNLNLDMTSVKKVNRFVILLFLIQVLASFIKYFSIGVRESYIGTVGIRGGTLSTIIPLLAISFIFIGYLFKTVSLKKAIWTSLGFVFISFVGAKRAFWFIIPIALSIIYYYYKTKFNKAKVKIKYFLSAIFIYFIFAVIFTSLGGKYNSSLNQQKEIGGTVDLSFMRDYVIDYNMKVGQKYSFGRVANFINIFNRFSNTNLLRSFFGDGPTAIKGYIRGDGLLEYYFVAGPITGLTYHLIQLGFLGCILIIIYYRSFLSENIQLMKATDDRFYQSIVLFGSIYTLIIFGDFLFYSTISQHHYSISLVFFYVQGIIYTHGRRLNEH